MQRRRSEVGYQDYHRIRWSVLSRRSSEGKILEGSELVPFTDQTFPPDLSSLSYVYSGDDKYEKMVFVRAKGIYPDPVFVGVGGFCVWPFPWTQWHRKDWLQGAMMIVSLSVKHMERLIPGYRNFEQSFDEMYIGAFRFQLWRFGEWTEIIVDDYLPCMFGQLCYCGAFGQPPELWGPLLEKAYAKCNRTYETIETGNMLNALTDMTGSICEHFTPDVNPPQNLFRILHKSCANRSLIVSWRNEKRVTSHGFNFGQSQDEDTNSTAAKDDSRYLHIMTAATKFPTTDGRMIEMVRLKCPFSKEPKWCGRYSENDKMTWEAVNQEFTERYRPLASKDADEYWLSVEDFRCNFGGLVICSSKEPFRTEGLNISRKYKKEDSHQIITDPQSPHSGLPNHPWANSAVKPPEPAWADEGGGQGRQSKLSSSPRNDTGPGRAREKPKPVLRKQKSCELSMERCLSALSQLSTLRQSGAAGLHREKTRAQRVRSAPARPSNDGNGRWSLGSGPNWSWDEAPPGSAFSVSDISVHIENRHRRDGSLSRLRSLPPRKSSLGSVSSLTQSNFLATRADYFRSEGGWKQLIDYRGRWSKNMKRDSDADSSCRKPRLLLMINKPEGLLKRASQPSYYGKSHVIISLIQDYRHGPSTANSLLVPIGFTVYKTKYPEKEERRTLSKLQQIIMAESNGVSREVTQRLDLEHGSYFIVPFCQYGDHVGEFILRVLGERNNRVDKSECKLS